MFQIITVPDNAGVSTEQLGTKQKIWVRMEGKRYLFKEPRPNTGEDWSEKVASELCELLGVPHTSYDLAIWRDKRGVLSPNFAPFPLRLVHGNELLAKLDKTYPAKRFFHVKEHVLRSVLAIIKATRANLPLGWAPVAGIKSASDVFVGYLMLDAWIGNQDRHHENWSMVVFPRPGSDPSFSLHLSPSYDHASSLGRNESDEVRKERLDTKDKGRSVAAYVERAKSAFYEPAPSVKQLSTLDAFCEAGKLNRDAAKIWLSHLNGISSESVHAILDQVPKHLISQEAIDFAFKMLEINRSRLLDTVGLFQ